jgi:hypothetical protein
MGAVVCFTPGREVDGAGIFLFAGLPPSHDLVYYHAVAKHS